MQSSSELVQILEQLEAEKRATTALAESARQIQQEQAFGASQGDANAIRALKRAEGSARRAATDLQRVELAAKQARRLLAGAREREAAEHVETSKAEFRKAGDALLSQDSKVSVALRALRSELEKRDVKLREVLALGRASAEIKPGAESRLTSRELLADAIAETLGNYLGHHYRGHVSNGAGVYFYENDLRALNREVPAREPLNSIEREARRSLEPSRFGRQVA